MKVLLDTTYLLPAVGISVKNLPEDAPLRLMQKGCQISISEISLFELSAKGAKYVASGLLLAERVAKGIRAVTYDENVTTITPYETKILLTAFDLRGLLSDFIDCLIVSSALHECDALVTEDGDIHVLSKEKDFARVVRDLKPEFSIQRMADAL